MTFGFSCDRAGCDRTDPGRTGHQLDPGVLLPDGWAEFPTPTGDRQRHLCDDCAPLMEKWLTKPPVTGITFPPGVRGAPPGPAHGDGVSAARRPIIADAREAGL